MPAPNRLRDLLTVAMMYQHTDYVLVADPSRRIEAQGVARSLGASRPEKSVYLDITSSPGAEAAAPHGTRRAVTIHLPALAVGGAPSPPFALVHLPRSDRLIGIAPGELSTAGAAALARSGGFTIGPAGLRLEYAETGPSRVNRIRAIVMNTFPSPGAKEIAYLGANGHFGPIAVWKTPGPIGDPVASFPDLRDPLATDPRDPGETRPAASGDANRLETASAVLADEGYP